MRTNGHFFDWGFGLAWTALVALIVGTTWLATPAQAASPVPVACATVPSNVTNTYYIDADDTRKQRGIVGYAVTTTPEGVYQISVVSETRAADIFIDPQPITDVCVLTVEVASSMETLVATAEDLDGTIGINDRAIATWTHLHDDVWEYNNFDQLKFFTSWNILSDVLSDENLSEEYFPVALWIIPIIALLVSVGIFIIAYGNAVVTAKQAITNQEAACSDAGHDCAESGYDPTDPACVYWYDQCGDARVFSEWCSSLNQSCNQGNQASCDLYWQHCGQ